jgi:TP901 family phage tail tape measure protein
MADFEKVYSIRFNVGQALTAIKKLDKSIDALDKKMIALTGRMARFGVQVRQVSKVFVSLSKEGKRTGKTLENFLKDRVPRAAKKTEKAVKRVNKRLRSTSDALSGFGRNMSLYVTAPLLAAGAASLKFSMNLNKGMAKIATLIPGQTKRIQELKEEIRALSVETGISTGDLTEGVYAAISAWGDSAETMKRMRVVTMAAQAGYASTEETLGLLSSLTEIYGDNTAKATEHLADMAFVANKLAIKAPFGEMAASMGKAAPLAKALNITQEELFATMAAGAGVTGNVTEVSTQQRSLFVAMTKESEAMVEVVKKTNKEFGTTYKTVGQLVGDKRVGLIGFLERLKDGTENTKEFQKALGGRVEGFNLALALTGERANKYNEALTEMSTKTGQMAEAHKEVTDGVNKTGHSWEKTKRRMEDAAVVIGDQLLPVLDQLLDALDPILSAIGQWDEDDVNLALTIAGVAAAIGPLIKGIYALNAAFTFLLANPIVATLVGIGLIVAMVAANFDDLVKDVEIFITTLDELYRKFKVFTSGAAAGFLKFIGFDVSGGDEHRAQLARDLENVQQRKGRLTGETQLNEEAREREANLQRVLKVTTPDASSFEDLQMQTLATSGGGGGSFSMGDTNVVVNAPGGNGDQIARQLSREMDKRDRRVRDGLKRVARAEAPGEQ